MKLTMLGTGMATVTECYNTCFVISDQDRHFLVDGGGGNHILKALKDAGVKTTEIHDIFVTHEHLDHILGILWLIRVIGTKMNQDKYEGKLNIYCHPELAEAITTIAGLTIQKKVCRLIGERIIFVPLDNGEKKKILGCRVRFFDIQSTKAKQYGFTMDLPDGKVLTCCGDEPYNENNYEYVGGSTWLMHEAFCLYSQRNKFKPYEKNHSTVKEACELAEKMEIPNLILYHTEEENLKNRKFLYTREGQEYYHGNLYVPDDMESFEL
ncbi:MBL fold metallo-hydrolase [Anaerobium acetethylicum]|uniref:Ribonuclease Z n=1 Tax=Anaerobium acetethylicum TaxID=1619234 RepID=A0A1D3TTM8_9FIRM|nr:MBL fold metallo-hydrolase [Anaerobium acetethylicum]SCP97370.1 ribonuclease Z [Anaerobium acetethylicum]